ncbi:asparagine synthase-related protein [Bacillus timonensis]|uniref:asparagine synthase-related protein n=1 Tax=Bacillus timonensis TaxID=1033734 RepID=UPI0002899DDC|nr:asparagine synthase-related protein [Bacillus timonensis]
MSAIAGFYNLNKEPIAIENCISMMQSLSKFPADAIQTMYKGDIFLGCHSQWITPESVGEPLPYYDFERQLAITADAIIDNREELFDKLDIKSDKRKNMPDSQLILLAYHKWGENTPKYLIGDFAFIIWDEKSEVLFGARDFSGSRTLYYYHDSNHFAFCSIIEPLLTLPFIKKQLNEEWLAEYLVVPGMIDAVNSEISPYKGIKQIPPSHSILIDRQRIRTIRYSNLASIEPLKFKTDEEYIDAFQEVFQKAVNARLRTYRKNGAQLSGGLDSGAVVSFAVKELKKENKELLTFSYVPPSDFTAFKSSRHICNERPYIKMTVNHVGGIKDHYLNFDGRDSFTEIDDFMEIMEMPYKFFENSFWLKGMFEKAYQEGVGVLLSGDRGNFTISWGFALDYYALLLKKFKWYSLISELNKYSKLTEGPRLGNLPYIARLGFPIIDKLFPQKNMYQLPKIINPNFAEKTKVFQKLKSYGMDQSGWYPNLNIFEERRKQFEDVFQWNAGNTLSSKLSLRYSLWKRDPTNDLRVVRFCLAVPEEQYVQNGYERVLVRKATKNYLPDSIRLNQRSRGIQGVDWVHRMAPHWDSYKEELLSNMNDKYVLEFLNGDLLKKAFTKVERGPILTNSIDPESKILMRSIIISRFIKKFI